MVNFAKKWLRLAQNGQFWSFCRFFHLFSQNEDQIDSEWPVSPDPQLFPSFATKASHFWRNFKNFCSGRGTSANFLSSSTFLNHFESQKFSFQGWGVGGGLHWPIFLDLQLFESFPTKVAQNDPQWPILPLKWLGLARNGQFWLNFNKNLNISVES